MSNKLLRYAVLVGIFAVPFVPLFVSSSLFFPFITGKAFIFRIIVEIAFAAWLVLALRDSAYRPKFSWILGSVLVFLFFTGLADIFAQNSYKAFWSNYERMEGFISLLHFGALFVVMGSVLNTQKLWNGLLATSVGVSAIMAIYSFFQVAGKIAINQGGVRVDGTLGNASYLGIYMVFHIFFAALLFTRSKSVWQKVLLAVVGTADIIVLYYTATRGAILGFIGGILIAFIFLALKSEKGSKIKKIAVVGFIAVAVLVGLFMAVRNSSSIRENPVLGRFSTLSFSEIKTQGRYYVWPMAIKGFTEKPVLGWGQEGFNYVFNKYYDPRMYNQEPWFDRAHNTYLDWMVAGGAPGILSYLAILFSLFYCIFKTNNESLKRGDKAVLLGAVTAYMFHNIFVFDQIASYILFFTVLSYAHSHAPESNPILWNKISSKFRSLSDSDRLRPVLESLVLIILVLILVFWNYYPWRQNKDLLEVLRVGNEGKIESVDIYTKPLSEGSMGFSESLEHISQAAISLASNPNAPEELKQGLFTELDTDFQNFLERVPNDARYRLFYGIFLSRFGWYGRAIEQLNKAVELSPEKQQIYFELTSNYLFDGKTAEAVQTAKTAFELEPSYQEARMVYGLALLASGNKTLSDQILSDIPESKIIFDDRYLTILLALKQYNQMINAVNKRIELDPTNLQHRITLTAAYLQADRRQEAVQTLREIIILEPSFKEQGEYYINEIEAGRNP